MEKKGCLSQKTYNNPSIVSNNRMHYTIWLLLPRLTRSLTYKHISESPRRATLTNNRLSGFLHILQLSLDAFK